MPETPQSQLAELKQALARFRRVRRGLDLAADVGRLLAVGLGAVLGWFLLDWAFRLGPWPLVLLFLAAAVTGLVALVRWGILPRFERSTPDQEALRVEALHGQLDNQLIGALQLGEETLARETDGQPLAYSSALVAALLARTAARLRELDPPRLLDRGPMTRALLQGGAVLLVSAACWLFAGDAVRERLDRLANAGDIVLETLFPVELRVTPETDLAVVRGSQVTLTVEVLGARRDEVTLLLTDDQTQDVTRHALPLHERRASFDLTAQDSFSFVFAYGEQRSEPRQVLVDDRPRIQAISYELAFPAYTGQPPRALSGRVPRLEGLAGTTVLVSFAATTELHGELSHVEWAGSPRQPLTINGRFGHFAFVLDRADRATVRLVGKYGPGFEMENPVEFDVAVRPDEPPSVRFLQQRRELTMLAEQAMLFSVQGLAEDDFGVAEISLEYNIGSIDEMLGRKPRKGEITRRITPPRDRVKDVFLKVFESLEPPLGPGDKITLVLSAKDNNTEAEQPGRGRSDPITIVVVRPDLGAFKEQEFGFGRSGAMAALQGLKRLKREANLMVDPRKSIRTEPPREIARSDVKSRVAQETWPSGAEDAVGDYFRVLSGGM